MFIRVYEPRQNLFLLSRHPAAKIQTHIFINYLLDEVAYSHTLWVAGFPACGDTTVQK